jgi:flagellar biosynthetic protein FliR
VPDLFAPGVASALVLVALRVGGLLLVAPLWSAKTVPMRLRTAALVMFAVLLLPTALASAPEGGVAITPATFLGETLIGFAIGMAGALIIAGAEAAGDLLSISIGLSGAAIVNPTDGGQTAVLGQFLQLFALTLLLTSGGHVLMLEALADTFRVLPLGGALDMAAGARALADTAIAIFAAAVRFAAPVLGAVMLGNMSLGVLSRAAPQLNIFSVAFPLQIGIGLLVLSLTIGVIAGALGQWPASFAGTLEQTMRALSPGALAPAGGR